jgi:hypothetical protein
LPNFSSSIGPPPGLFKPQTRSPQQQTATTTSATGPLNAEELERKMLQEVAASQMKVSNFYLALNLMLKIKVFDLFLEPKSTCYSSRISQLYGIGTENVGRGNGSTTTAKTRANNAGNDANN